jgi:hypothetical protein
LFENCEAKLSVFWGIETPPGAKPVGWDVSGPNPVDWELREVGAVDPVDEGIMELRKGLKVEPLDREDEVAAPELDTVMPVGWGAKGKLSAKDAPKEEEGLNGLTREPPKPVGWLANAATGAGDEDKGGAEEPKNKWTPFVADCELAGPANEDARLDMRPPVCWLCKGAVADETGIAGVEPGLEMEGKACWDCDGVLDRSNADLARSLSVGLT